MKSVTKLRKEIRAKGGSSCSIIGSKIKSSLNLPVNNDTLCDSKPFANEPVIKSKIEPISFRRKANDFRTKLEEPLLVEATEPINVKDYTNNLTHGSSYGHVNPQAVGFVPRPEPASSNQRAAAFLVLIRTIVEDLMQCLLINLRVWKGTPTVATDIGL